MSIQNALLRIASSVSILLIGVQACAQPAVAPFDVSAVPDEPWSPDGTLSVPQIFPSDNPWNTDISGYPVHPNSDNYLASIGLETGLHPDFGTEWNGAPNGIPYVLVSGDQPVVPIDFLYDDESDPGPYPIPPNAPIEGGPDSDGDRHVIVIDADNKLLYETYRAFPQDGGASWFADAGAIFDLTSNDLRPLYWTSAGRGGGCRSSRGWFGMTRWSSRAKSTTRCVFTVSRSQRAFILPATHFASSSTDPNRPPMGLRLRLKADYDIFGVFAERADDPAGAEDVRDDRGGQRVGLVHLGRAGPALG